MEKTAITDFLKEIAVGFKTAKSYPPGHPVMEKVVIKTINQLNKINNEFPEFSMYFLEKTVIFQDIRIDIGKNPAMASLLKSLRKVEINSLTFKPGVSNEDVRNLYDVIISPKLKIKEFGDAATMLKAKGTQGVKINAVKFGIQTGTGSRVAKKSKAAKEQAQIVESIKNLKGLVEQGISALGTKSKFAEVMDDIENTPGDSQRIYREGVARIFENLPTEHRIELLNDIELKPMVLKMLSSFSDDTLVNLIFKQKTQDTEDKGDDIKKILGSLGESKFADILPKLKEKIPNIYEYLAQIGLLLSENLATTISKDDLRIAMKPYYTMADSDNANVRERGLRSLISLAQRFAKKKNYEQAGEFITRISSAIKQEAVPLVISHLLDDLAELYNVCREHNQKKYCSMLVGPFSTILGREGHSTTFKKQNIKYLSETGDVETLPILFSFLWEAGIYPDVRDAIVKFGKDAVNEALLTLKEAEDQDLRRKLVDILEKIGPQAIEILLENLGITEDWFLKRHIIAILGGVGDASVIERLVPVIEDEDERVRAELVKAFTKFKYTEGLLKLLKDPSSEVKAEALKGLKDKIGSDMIIECLSLFKQKGDAMHIELLKIIGDKKFVGAADAVIEFVKTLAVRKDSDADQLKELGISVLMRLDHENIKQILEDLTLVKDKKISQFSKKALQRIA